MALLSAEQLAEVSVELMRDWSATRESRGGSKDAVSDMVGGLDKFISDNESEITAAIPEPARTTFTDQQRAKAMVLVINKRYQQGA